MSSPGGTVPFHSLTFRGSFLRFHVASCLSAAQGGRTDARRLVAVDDLLSIKSLRARIEFTWRQMAGEAGPYDFEPRIPDDLRNQLNLLTTPRHFFGFVHSEGMDALSSGTHLCSGLSVDIRERAGSLAALSSNPEYRLYCPVPVRLIEPPQDIPTQFDDLSHLLAELSNRSMKLAGRRGYGVLLRSRSGAGKTVACWRAWFDCLEVDSLNSRESKPMLDGSVPCWIRGVNPAELRQLKSYCASSIDLVFLLLARAAGMLADHNPITTRVYGGSITGLLQRIREFCAYGPRLLIFVDLNHFDSGVRWDLARGLREFQDQHADVHCCVVTYRSAVRDDITSEIFAGKSFLVADLRPLPPSTAASYLRNFRNYEAELFRSLSVQFPGLDAPQRDIEEECHQLDRLIARTQSRGEPLIATPLLMHWAAEMSTDELRHIHNITHLYRHVVDKHVNRQRHDLARCGLESDALLTAMTRVALVIQSQDNRVRIPIGEAREALRHPRGDHGKDKSWWPADDFWLKTLCPYYHTSFSEGHGATPTVDPERNQLERVLEYGLFRRDEDQLGFVHDSLISYFTGSVALREYLGPKIPGWTQSVDVPDNRFEWINHAYARIVANPQRWVHAVEFLAGALEPLPVGDPEVEPIWMDSVEQLQDNALILVQALALSSPSETTVRLAYHAARGASRIVVLDLLAQAIEERRSLLMRRPHLLPQVIQHFFNHLAHQAADTTNQNATSPSDGLFNNSRLMAVANLIEQQFLRLRLHLVPQGTPWLRLIHGSRSPAVLHTSDDFRARVTAVLVIHWPVSGDVVEEWVLAGLANGELHLWHPNSGNLHFLGRHASPDNSATKESCEIVLLRHGFGDVIHSADDRGGVRAWTPLRGDTPRMRMQTITETGVELNSILSGFPQFRELVSAPDNDVAGLDRDGRLHFFRSVDFSRALMNDELSLVNVDQKGLCALAAGQFVTSRGSSLRTIERDAGILEQLFSADFSIDRIKASQSDIAVWKDYGSQILVWDRQRGRTRGLHQFEESLLGVALPTDGSLIVVTQRQVLQISGEANRVVLYPPTEEEPHDQDKSWSCIELCACTQDLVLMSDDGRWIVIPLTTEADRMLAAVPGAVKRVNGYTLLSRSEHSDEHVARITWSADVGIVSILSDGSICATSLEGDSARHSFAESPLIYTETVTPGPPESVLITVSEHLWRFDFPSRTLTPVASGIWDSIPGELDMHNRIYAASRDCLWRINPIVNQSELLCDLQGAANASIEGMNVTLSGHVLIAASNGAVYRWRSRKEDSVESAFPVDASVTTSDAVLCPHMTLLRVDGNPGLLNAELGTLSGNMAITSLANGATANELLAGCNNGDVYRWQFDNQTRKPLYTALLARLKATGQSDPGENGRSQDSDTRVRVDRIVSSSRGDVFILTHRKATRQRGSGKDVYTVWAVVEGVLMPEPLWEDERELALLACIESGHLIAVTGDGVSPSQFIRWNRQRVEDSDGSRVIFQQQMLLEGGQDDADFGVSAQDVGAIVGMGQQTLACVTANNECRISAFDLARPVLRLKKDDQHLVTIVEGSTVEDVVAFDGNLLLKLGPEGREVLQALTPQVVHVSSKDGPAEWPSRIDRAYRSPPGNIVCATTVGHVYYHDVETGKRALVSEPDVRESGRMRAPKGRHIAIDSQGRILDWHEVPDCSHLWHLLVWNPGDERARLVFEYRKNENTHGERVTSGTFLSSGDLVFTIYIRRGENRMWRPDRPAQPAALSGVYRVAAGEWKAAVLLHEIRWDDPWDRMWICSVAEWNPNRLLLGFENGRIGVLHLPASGESSEAGRFEWLCRSHDPQPVIQLKGLNASCFASTSGSQLQIGTMDDVLLEYTSDEGIRSFVFLPGEQPQCYVDEGTGTMLQVVGDISSFRPD